MKNGSNRAKSGRPNQEPKLPRWPLQRNVFVQHPENASEAGLGVNQIVNQEIIYLVNEFTLDNIVDLPLSVLITRPSAVSQAWFAREAINAVNQGPMLHAEPTQDGLVLRGLTEADLEFAYLALKKKFEDVRCGNPSVEYVDGGALLEPYYSARVDAPEYFIGTVVSDLNSRRATILNMTDIPGGKRIKADVPVAECLGYSTALRRITRARGEYTFEFAGYRPTNGRPNPDDVV